MLMLCAGLALVTALHNAGAAGEAQMMLTIRNCLMVCGHPVVSALLRNHVDSCQWLSIR